MINVSEQGIRDANPEHEFGPAITYKKGVCYMVFTDARDGIKRRIVFNSKGHSICREPPARGAMSLILGNLKSLR